MKDYNFESEKKFKENTEECYQEVKNNYPAMGARDFEFEFKTASFDEREVNTMLSQDDYDCWIQDIILNIDGTVLIKCKCEEGKDEE